MLGAFSEYRCRLRRRKGPVASLLALLSAAAFGAGDFLGGLATRRSERPATTVVLVAHIVGFFFMAALAPLFGLDPAGNDILWGVLAGLAGVVGLVLLYHGLAVGVMSVVAPITALGAAVVPVAYGLATGERPAAGAVVGAAAALLAIFLVSRPADAVTPETPIWKRWREGGLVAAVGAGVAFGVFFILLAETSSASGLLPLVAARATSVAALALVVALFRQPVRFARPALWLVVGAGLFDAGANALFLAAARSGLLSLVAVLAALYPAATILLARVVLGERIGRIQQLGLAAGLVGIVLIAAA